MTGHSLSPICLFVHQVLSNKPETGVLTWVLEQEWSVREMCWQWPCSPVSPLLSGERESRSLCQPCCPESLLLPVATLGWRPAWSSFKPDQQDRVKRQGDASVVHVTTRCKVVSFESSSWINEQTIWRTRNFLYIYIYLTWKSYQTSLKVHIFQLNCNVHMIIYIIYNYKIIFWILFHNYFIFWILYSEYYFINKWKYLQKIKCDSTDSDICFFIGKANSSQEGMVIFLTRSVKLHLKILLQSSLPHSTCTPDVPLPALFFLQYL